MKNILIACPVRNREWILWRYLRALEILDYPGDKLSFHFILNDSIDDSKNILYIWKNSKKNDFKSIQISEVNFNFPEYIDKKGYRQDCKTRHKFAYPALSILRNLILDISAINTDIDYLFSVDSDVILYPDILNRLLSEDKDIVAGLIKNGVNEYNFLPFKGNRSIVPEGAFEVKTTGAVMLISREVFENKAIRYSPKPSGEDEGFCESARARGFKSFVLPELQEHVMRWGNE